MQVPPGPRGPSVIETARFVGDPYAFFERMRSRYGPAVRVRLAAYGDTLWVVDPAWARTLLVERQDFLRGVANEVLEPFVGRYSLLTLDGPEHLRQRRLLLPPFHGERMQAYRDTMAEAAEAEVASWPSGSPFAVRPRMQALTLEVILRTIFGAQEEHERAPLREAMGRLTRMANFLFVPTPLRRDFGGRGPWARFTRARAALDAAIHAQVAARRADDRSADRDDILSLLLSARDEAGEPMTAGEIRDELTTLVVAGYETTATSLAWALDLLLHDAPALERATEAARAGDDEYLDAVGKEAMRLRPVVFAVARVPTEPVEVHGWSIPAHTRLWAPISALHRDPDLFPDPLAFRPERFLESRPASYAYIPFGGGIRRCIGASFASLEMREALRAILASTRLRAASSELERPRLAGVTVVPRRGTRVIA